MLQRKWFIIQLHIVEWVTRNIPFSFNHLQKAGYLHLCGAEIKLLYLFTFIIINKNQFQGDFFQSG